MSAPSTPPPVVPGDVYELTGEDPLGDGYGMLPAGAVVTVIDVVDQGTPGVGRAEAQTVIASHRYYDLPTRDAAGEYHYLEHTRHIAVALWLFRERFEPCDADPAPARPEGV